MILIKHLVYLLIFRACNGQRRIMHGHLVKVHKKFMVYLVQADADTQEYDYWLCGGALVSHSFILTSAACVEDVKYLYAIAGYNKYVTNDEFVTDDCIMNTRKKIVYTCVPKSYKLNYKKIDEWAYIDIALAKVESPYSKNDKNFDKYCDYVPEPISINYEKKFQEPGTDVIVMGWGHRKKWRRPDDTKNYNERCLRYASTKIINKSICKEEYAGIKNMKEVIDEYMICTFGKGDLNEEGNVRNPGNTNFADGCSRRDVESGNCDDINGRRLFHNNSAIHRTKHDYNSYEIINRRSYSSLRKESRERSKEIGRNRREKSKDQEKSKERSREASEPSEEISKFEGICQNDHGGPLITWAGAHEQVIGVASVFRVDRNSECGGPFLFTSTQCNGKFLNCILSSKDKKIKRRFKCDGTPEEKGYVTHEKTISWKRHPDGPAADET